MKIKKIVCLLACLFMAFVSRADSLTYNGYTLDRENGVITDPRGLEWLRWSKTVNKGESVRDVVSRYSDDGWRIATSSEVLVLLNDFGVNWTSLNASKTQFSGFEETVGDNVRDELDLQLIALFGETPCPIDESLYKYDDLKFTSVYFEADNFSPYIHKRISLLDDLESVTLGVRDSRGYVIGHRASNNYQGYKMFTGVALVKD